MSDLRDRIADALRAHDIEVDDAGSRCVCGGWYDLDDTDLDGHLADVAAGVAEPEIAERDAALDRVRELHPAREVAPIYPIDTRLGRPGYTECATCRQPYPCPSVRTIDGSTDE